MVKKQVRPKPRPQPDERPPVVVSSGSVIIDPTSGSFEPDTSTGREWRNKGKPHHGKPVRFEVTVEGNGGTQTFEGKKIDITVAKTSETASVKLDIHQGDLRIKSGNPFRQPSKNREIVLDEWSLQRLDVSGGGSPGGCTLSSSSVITIDQKNS